MFVAGAIAWATPVVYDRLYERLQFGPRFTPSTRFAQVVENRSGVIAVTPGGDVYGGGAYDGGFNVSLDHDINRIFRAYAISAMLPAPRRVLMIGLGSGSWAQVVANLPGVESLTAVEINPGYAELIATHPEVKSLLRNPHVELVIDDGRRWLQRHPQETFDVIVMNTTWNWRAHATNLLSVEFMNMAKRHLRPGGLLYFNSTGSPAAQHTAASVFSYALRVFNFVAVSDAPIVFDKEGWSDALQAMEIDGRPVIDRSDPAMLARVLSLADTLARPPTDAGLESRESLVRRTAAAPLVTDDNMVTEWAATFRGR